MARPALWKLSQITAATPPRERQVFHRSGHKAQRTKGSPLPPVPSLPSTEGCFPFLSRWARVLQRILKCVCTSRTRATSLIVAGSERITLIKQVNYGN